MFSVNDEFTDKKKKIKIPNVVARISEKESEQIDKLIDDDRKYAIDAAIVRIMKSNKKMKHSNLVGNAVSQLMTVFSPDVGLVKKRIEHLIEQEFLDRDETERDTYNYRA